MPLPGTATFGEGDPFDSPAGVIAYHRAIEQVKDQEGAKVSFTLRLSDEDQARLIWLAQQLDVGKTTLARELLHSAIIEAMDSMNLVEDSKGEVLEDISDIVVDLRSGSR